MILSRCGIVIADQRN